MVIVNGVFIPLEEKTIESPYFLVYTGSSLEPEINFLFNC